MAISYLSLVCLLYCMMETEQGTLRRGQLCVSQFPQPAIMMETIGVYPLLDPRVGRITADRPGVRELFWPSDETFRGRQSNFHCTPLDKQARCAPGL